MRRSSDIPFLTAMLNHTNDKISFVDTSYTYLAVNKEYVNTFQKPVEKIIGKKMWEVAGQKAFLTAKEHIDKALAGEKISYEEWFDLPQQRAYLQVSYSPFYQHNQVVGVVATVIDLTKAKQLQIENENNYKLLLEKSKTAKLGSMVTFITHQMRQPLNSIATSLMKMDMHLQEKDYEGISELIDLNEHVVDHLSKTLDSISEYHNLNGFMEDVNIRYIIDNALLILEHLILSHNIHIEIVCDKDLKVKTIKSELIHILIILINNACEAIEESHADKKNITIEVIPRAQKTYINVYDSSNGVHEEVLPHLFKIGTTTKNSTGHGYGLYFARKILKTSLGGTIEYISEKEKHYFQICLHHSE